MENSGGGLDSILFCFIVNLLLWLQDQVIYGNKLWGMNLKGFNTKDSRETSQFAGDGSTVLEVRARREDGTERKPTELHGQAVVREWQRKNHYLQSQKFINWLRTIC